MAFVVSDGELRAIERRAPTAPTYTMRVGTDHYRDYAQLYRSQPELRTVVDFLARNLAQLGIHVFERVSDVDRKRLNDHDLARLLRRPNPTTTAYRMIDTLVHDMCVYDDAYWLKIRDSGDTASKTPRALRRIKPTRIRPAGDDWWAPEQYVITGNKGKLEVDESSVVHFHGYNPDDDRQGASPIESLRQVLAEEWAANQYREQLWRNGARIGGIVSRSADAPDWGSKGRDRFKAEFRAAYSGDSADAGSVVVLEDGMTFTAATVTPRDSQYIESRKLTREEVARAYHVPLPMVGILDHATFTNIKELHKNLYQDCLGPWIEQIQQELELQLLPDLPHSANVYVEFNISAKLAGSFEEQAAQLRSAIGVPYMVPNEGRARLNLPMIEGGDTLAVPLNVNMGVEGSPDEPAPTPTGPPDETPPKQLSEAQRECIERTADALVKFFTRQGAAVLSHLGAEKARGAMQVSTKDVFDAQRWDNELAADLLLAAHKAMAADASPVERADSTAQSVNADTMADLKAALTGDLDQSLPAVNALFDSYRTDRVQQIATALVVSVPA